MMECVSEYGQRRWISLSNHVNGGGLVVGLGWASFCLLLVDLLLVSHLCLITCWTYQGASFFCFEQPLDVRVLCSRSQQLKQQS